MGSKRRDLQDGATAASARPRPPDSVLDSILPTFSPAPEIDAFVARAFLDPDSPLYNEEHDHLGDAKIGYLWTNAENRRGEYPVAGTCERPKFEGNKWQRARQEMQFRDWFGRVPDFVITLNAPYLSSLSDMGFCAVLDHELMHAGQARDDYGAPRFNSQTGEPVYVIRPHDVEEFVAIVERYGAGHAAGATRQMVEAARRKPTLTSETVEFACGTCRR